MAATAGRNRTSFKPGERPVGRAKGTPNKVTADVREMIRGALDDAGGRAYLARQAKSAPRAFMALIGTVVPKEVHATLDVVVNLDYTRREPDETAE